MDNEKEIVFKCPVCGGNAIEAIGNNAEVITGIKKIVGYDIEWLPTIIGECPEIYYQCVKCGYIIQDNQGRKISDDEDLIDWLKEEMTKRTALNMVSKKDEANG